MKIQTGLNYPGGTDRVRCTRNSSAEVEMKGVVLVVGANGFVGRALTSELARRDWQVRAAARQLPCLPHHVESFIVPDLTAADLDWKQALSGVDAVVYLAARVHVMNDDHPDPLAAYRAVNTHAALTLARQAAEAGTKRMIYLSSVKVNGEMSPRPLRESDPSQPADPYGVSKHEAEEALGHLARTTKLEVVIVRPPLVYGPGVKANFASLQRAARLRLPVPIGAVTARRSLVYLENLTDLLITVLDHPQAAGQVFFVSDGEDLSPPELLRQLAAAYGHTLYLPRVPVFWLQILGRLVGRAGAVTRLTQPLQLDISKARELLAWTPPIPQWQALARTVLHHPPTENNPLVTTSAWKLSAAQHLYLQIRGIAEKVIALFLLILLSPLCLGVAILISLDSPGGALFVQERAGRRHVPFRMYKFRTMRADAPQLSTEDMQRSTLNPVTRIGSLLRRTSLDEIPQLVNVLLGHMSLIGPRPALLTQEDVLGLRAARGVDQLSPGVTGYAQVTGRDNLSTHDKVERDTVYLQHLGLRLDLKILAMTVHSVLRGTGNK